MMGWVLDVKLCEVDELRVAFLLSSTCVLNAFVPYGVCFV